VDFLEKTCFCFVLHFSSQLVSCNFPRLRKEKNGNFCLLGSLSLCVGSAILNDSQQKAILANMEKKFDLFSKFE
jgi:hypothetical protein